MSRGLDWGIVAGGALIAALLAAWLAAAGWLEPAAFRLWATTAMAWRVPGFALDELFLVYPHLWLLAALLLVPIGPSAAAAGLAAAAAVAAGIATALWYGLLRRQGWAAHWALLLTGLCLFHPFTLWIVSRGGPDSVALLAASLLVVVLARFARGFEPRHVVVLALVLGFGLLLDPRWALYALMVVPFLPFLVGRAWLDEAAPGLLIVALVPLTGALLFLTTVGWIFGGRPLAFLLEGGLVATGPDAPFPGASAGFVTEPLLLLAATLAAAPVLGLALWRCRGRRLALVLLGTCLPAAGLLAANCLGATWGGLDFLPVAVVASVLGLAMTRRLARPYAVVGLLLAGHLGGWLVLPALGGERIAAWRAALSHAPMAQPFAAERALAGFLADGPMTLIDDRHGFAVIVASGAGDPLVLPPSPAFASQLLQPVPTIAQIALPAPALAERDRIIQRHPGLWADGLPGYRLVYDHASWRVWRRGEHGHRDTAELRRCPTDPMAEGHPIDGGRRALGPRAIACRH